MKPRALLAAAALFTLSLAACSGPPEEAGETAADAPADAVPTASVPGEIPGAVPTPGATDAVPTPVATPTPGATVTPTPTASATSRPAATPAVAAGPPAAFSTCGVCHSVTPGQNMIGPSLAGVFGRRSGAVPGFAYSQGAKDTDVLWNDGTLDRYLADPTAVVPGTTMPAPGVDAAQRRAIIAYLKTL